MRRGEASDRWQGRGCAVIHWVLWLPMTFLASDGRRTLFRVNHLLLAWVGVVAGCAPSRAPALEADSGRTPQDAGVIDQAAPHDAFRQDHALRGPYDASIAERTGPSVDAGSADTGRPEPRDDAADGGSSPDVATQPICGCSAAQFCQIFLGAASCQSVPNACAPSATCSCLIQAHSAELGWCRDDGGIIVTVPE